MVDIIKLLPHTATSFSSNAHHLQPKVFNQEINLSIQTKRWFGNYPSNSTSLIDVSKSPYAIHRKIMYQQLSRHCPITIDSNRSPRNKQHGTSKETTKTNGTNITPQPSVTYGDVQSTRLFDTLSKHVTVKAEPLRSSNGLIANPTNPVTSWQKYWTSTHTQRRRKEANDSEPALYRPKREQTLPGQNHFVVLRDSEFLPNESRQYGSETSTSTDTNPHTKLYNLTIAPDKPISSIKDDEIKKPPLQISTIEFVASSLIPACNEMNSNTMISKMSTMLSLKSTDKEDDKNLTDKSSLSSSSHFKNDSQLIDDASDEQLDSRLITTKVYKLSIPVDQSKQSKKSPIRKIIHSKPTEKKQIRASSASKRKRQVSMTKRSMNKFELSTIIAATSISKYSERKWEEPYIGLRLDPPTPPSSPTLFVWVQDSDEEDEDTIYEKSEIFENNSPDQVSKN